jgi:multidrug efflux system outer membrane protein
MHLKWRALTVLSLLAVARAASASGDDPLAAPAAPSTIRLHQFSLQECLSLSDRNFPNLWAARARLAYVHAQLDEAKWTPWFQWSANSSFGVAPPLLGTVVFPQSSFNQGANISSVGGLQPFFHFDINGVVPLYTFGKMENAVRAA